MGLVEQKSFNWLCSLMEKLPNDYGYLLVRCQPEPLPPATHAHAVLVCASDWYEAAETGTRSCRILAAGAAEHILPGVPPAIDETGEVGVLR